MRGRLVTNAVMILVLLLIMTFFVSNDNGVARLPASEEFVSREDHIWIWDYIWAGSYVDEVSAGSPITFSLGWTSPSRETLDELLMNLEIEFHVAGREIASPKRHFAFQDVGSRTDSYWMMTFLYQHGPLEPGEYSWWMSLGGSVEDTVLGGLLIVSPR